MYHKGICSDNVAIKQTHGETPEQKAYQKKIRRYMIAWTPAIMYCLPVALDLANHEWGRHDTHVYVRPSALGSKFDAFSNSASTRSLLIRAEHTGLDADHELYRVGEFYIVQHVCMKSDLCRYLILL